MTSPRTTTQSPYYSVDGITIYNGDCLDVMPSVKADAVVTDPPYGLDFRGASWDQSIPVWLAAAREAAPVVIFTTAPTTLWDYPKPDWVLCWARPASNSRTAQGGFNHWSPVVMYGKRKFPTDLLSLHAIANSAADWNTHPSPKPERLMRWLIVNATDDGATVLDPFMGSGTTLVAAKALGRKAIGIEIDERYCELAVSRLTQQTLGLSA